MNDSYFNLDDIWLEEANDIFYYKYNIFKDLSRIKYINGDELRDIYQNKDIANDGNELIRQRGSWLFFYRPHCSKLPHNKHIKKTKEKINLLKSKISSIKDNHTYQMAGIIISTAFLAFTSLPFIIPALCTLVGLPIILLNKKANLNNINAKIYEENKNLLKLETQLNRLKKQAKNRYTREQMDKLWKNKKYIITKEILRYGSLNEKTNLNEDTTYFLTNWGVHHPDKIFTDGFYNDTGLESALNSLGKNILTWRNGRGYKDPLYRLVYCQILIMKKEGIISGRAFYDVIKGDFYGKKSEFIRNDHISNIKIQQIPIPNNEALKSLAHEKFHPVIFINKAKSISLPTSSGSIFNCILTNPEEQSNAFKDWLEFLNAETLKDQLYNREPLKT